MTGGSGMDSGLANHEGADRIRTGVSPRTGIAPNNPPESNPRLPRRRGTGGYVYFVRPRVGAVRPIKVGTSVDLAKRLSDMQRAWPVALELLAATKGGPAYEAEIHAQAADDRLYGEWFSETSLPVWLAIHRARDEWGVPEGLTPPAGLEKPVLHTESPT